MGFLDKFWRVERDRTGNIYYEFGNTSGFQNGTKYLEYSLTNPVLLTIISLRCKVFSQMKITHLNAQGNPIENSPLLKLLKNPNYFQSQEDFLYQSMWFLSATGNNITYQVKALNEVKSLYNLIPSEIDYNNTEKINKFITTKNDFKAYGEKHIVYTLDDKTYNIKLSELIPFYDLANGLSCNSFMMSPSRLKGLSNVIENINENLKAKNVNLKMSQKYLVSNKSTGNEAQIQEPDRKDITSKLGQKSLIITNAALEAKHLVSDMKKLFLDEQFADDAMKCLLAFEMSKDVLNYFSNGASTYENKTVAGLDYIQNSIQVDANNFLNSIASSFGLNEIGETLVASYNHLPVMAQVMKDKIDTFKAFQETLKISIETGTILQPEAQQMTNDFRLNIGL
jgi:hypothetical protein